MKTVIILPANERITVGKILCIGQNYAAHAAEMKSVAPTIPVFFMKPTTSLMENGGTIVIPSISQDVHHEVEMTVLIGKDGKNIPLERAREHVAGYGIGLDMTMRDVQSEAKKKGHPWTLAKGFDTSAPISSFVPVSSVADPGTLRVQLTVNGTVRQSSGTNNMIHSVDALIFYISQFFTLERGDIIFTGTPEGVAQVKSGDTLTAELLQEDGKALASLTVRVA
jgi:acylpyruvate hydrolase